jgi:hypothetical protein
VIGRRWIRDPQGPRGQRFYVSAREIAGIRQAVRPPGAAAGAPVPHAPGWTQIIATGNVVGDVVAVTDTGSGQATGEFLIAGRRSSGLTHMVIRAPVEAGKALRRDDYVRVTGTLAMDPALGGGLDEHSIHVVADHLDVLATDIRSKGLRTVTATQPRLASVHRPPTAGPGIGL